MKCKVRYCPRSDLWFSVTSMGVFGPFPYIDTACGYYMYIEKQMRGSH